MWSGTSGYVLDQSDNRIHKTAISLEWVEGWNCFFRQIYLKMQPFDSNNGSAQKCPDTFKSTHKVLSKWGVCIICLKSWWRYEIEISYMVGINRCNMWIQDMSQTVCSCHVTYAFENESTLYSCLNAKELLARSRREIWRWSDCNSTRTQNHLVECSFKN